MEYLDKYTTEQLINMLADCTVVYSRMMKDGTSDEEYKKYKLLLDRLVATIRKRRAEISGE